MKRLAFVFWIAAMGPALAQSNVQVIGPITTGNIPQFSSNTIIKDSGAAGAIFGAMPANTVVCNPTGTTGPAQDCNKPWISVLDFGAVGDGVTDNTTAINNAMTAANLRKGCVYFPASANPYLTGLITGQTLSCWVGDGQNNSVIKLKNSANSGIFTAGTSGTEANDVSLSNLTLDGNMANNTSGDTLVIYGNRPRLINIMIQNSPGTGITTTSNIADGNITTSVEGYFNNVRIDSTQHHGWLCNGPNDSYFGMVHIEDAGLATDNTYYAMFMSAASGLATLCNGRFVDFHSFNRDGTTNTPFTALQINTSGNNFVNSHFEGGHLSLGVAGNNNIIQGDAYGTRGTFAASVTGSGNIIDLATGLVAASANPNYKCLNLAGSLNIIRLTAGVCNNGIIDFTSDGGFNNVTIATVNTGSTVNEFVGTPVATDVVSIQASGTNPVRYGQIGTHLALTGGALPVASSCGTSPAVAGSDTMGSIVTGTGATACTLTFNTAFVAAPFCFVVAASGTQVAFTRTNAALTLTTAAASSAYFYMCMAQIGG